MRKIRFALVATLIVCVTGMILVGVLEILRLTDPSAAKVDGGVYTLPLVPLCLLGALWAVYGLQRTEPKIPAQARNGVGKITLAAIGICGVVAFVVLGALLLLSGADGVDSFRANFFQIVLVGLLAGFAVSIKYLR